MANFLDHDPIPEPPELRERFEALQAKVDAIAVGVGMMLAALSQQPMDLSVMRTHAQKLGYEKPSELLVVR